MCSITQYYIRLHKNIVTISVPKCSLSYGGYRPGNDLLESGLKDMRFDDCNSMCHEIPECHGVLWGNLHHRDWKRTCHFKNKSSAQITPQNGQFTSVPRICCKKIKKLLS